MTNNFLRVEFACAGFLLWALRALALCLSDSDGLHHVGPTGLWRVRGPCQDTCCPAALQGLESTCRTPCVPASQVSSDCGSKDYVIRVLRVRWLVLNLHLVGRAGNAMPLPLTTTNF